MLLIADLIHINVIFDQSVVWTCVISIYQFYYFWILKFLD